MMLRLLLIIVAWLPAIAMAAEAPATQPAIRFAMVDVVVDSADKPLAAWQVELKTTSGNVKIVGVESGDHGNVYRDPPYYDPAALAGGRIILASFTTDSNAPKGRIVVARVHLQVEGNYELTTSLITGADAAGKPVAATATVRPAAKASEKE